MSIIKPPPGTYVTGPGLLPGFRRQIPCAILAASLLSGCVAVPANKLLLTEGRADSMRQVQARNNRLVELFRESDPRKPLLILLHGATVDPTEMLDIAQGARDRYQVFLFSYNHHQRVEHLANDLVSELERLKAQRPAALVTTVVVYSYSAIIFRQAVIAAHDPQLFADTWLIQLVPTAGGSFLARWMSIPGVAWLVSLASKPSAAENPYGRFARHLWEGEGKRTFDRALSADRVRTILLDEDRHSLAQSHDSRVLARYQNGIGTNVVVIPSSFGVNHDYLPSNPIALEYVRTLLEPPPGQGVANPALTAAQDQTDSPPPARVARHSSKAKPAGGS